MVQAAFSMMPFAFHLSMKSEDVYLGPASCLAWQQRCASGFTGARAQMAYRLVREYRNGDCDGYR